MIEVRYRREVPYPQAAVLSQYFDLEHIAHVHPPTLGKARLLACLDNAVEWELECPRFFGITLRSVIRQEYLESDRIHARVTKGLLRGTEVLTHLKSVDGGTLIEELYLLPVPELPLVSQLARVWLCRKADEIWDGDVAVGLPRGGWPGVPRPTASILTPRAPEVEHNDGKADPGAPGRGIGPP
jgi:hypothetical protein